MAGSILYNSSTVGVTANAAGTSGQVLVSSGTSSPTWKNPGLAVYFKAYFNSTPSNVTGDGTLISPLIFDTAEINAGSGYSTSTGRFTAPSAGTYLFSSTLYLYNLNPNHIDCTFAITSNGAGYAFYNNINPSTVNSVSASRFTVSGTGMLKCNSGQLVYCMFRVIGDTKTVGIVGGTGKQSSFTGIRIGD